VLWHLLAKETEIRNLRILLVSKANSTDRAITRRLLRRGTPG
jgi:vacuolar-type H+-ATPase subunit C/Vma6